MVLRFRTALFISVLSYTLTAQEKEATVSSLIQLDVIRQFETAINENYIIPDKRPILISGLEAAIKDGSFNQTMSIEDFVNLTNRIIQASFPDRHLGLLSPQKYDEISQLFSDDHDQTDEQGETPNSAHHSPAKSGHTQADSKADRHNRERKGQEALKQLTGITRVSEINRDGLNQIAYIAFDRLIASEKAKAIVQQIFNTFTESERMIIDLRDCGGGDADMVRFISNYFFNKPTHLLTTVIKGNDPIERWTEVNSLSPVFSTKKLDILISKRTFSAAESFTFGMRQTGRARILGESSGGGGHMNDFFALAHGFGASISIGRTFDPRTGDGWQTAGIQPDIRFEKDHTLSEAIRLITAESGKLNKFSSEQRSIYNQLQDYTYAWYNADSRQMKELISADFKAQYTSNHQTISRDHDAQLEATERGEGFLPKLFHNRIIKNLTVSGNVAAVDLILRETVHKIKFVKQNDSWKVAADTYIDKTHG